MDNMYYSVPRDETINQYGVLGMKWGVRKARYTDVANRSARQLTRFDSARKKRKAKAAKLHAKADKASYKAAKRMNRATSEKKMQKARKMEFKAKKIQAKASKMDSQAARIDRKATRFTNKVNKSLGVINVKDLDPAYVSAGRRYGMNIASKGTTGSADIARRRKQALKKAKK